MDRIDPLEAMDRIDPLEAIDRIDPADPIEPRDATEAAEASESTEPADAADSADATERHDSTDHREPRDSTERSTEGTVALLPGTPVRDTGLTSICVAVPAGPAARAALVRRAGSVFPRPHIGIDHRRRPVELAPPN
jgi:hypothetical protein